MLIVKGVAAPDKRFQVIFQEALGFLSNSTSAF